MTPDTDGDDVLDALDDQDHDSFTNVAELSRRRCSADPADDAAPVDLTVACIR